MVTNDQGFIAPVELEGLAQFEAYRNERFGRTDCPFHPPTPDVVGDAVAAAVALGLYLSKQDAPAAPSLLVAMNVGCECLMQGRLEGRELATGFSL
jgi:hypothetical protein